MIEQTKATPYVLVREARFPGCWGRGETLAEAARNARANGANVGGAVYACACDTRATVDERGELHSTARGPIYNGTLTAYGVTLSGKLRD